MSISACATQTYDVLIIGAGPVGLATAIGLRQRGIENILVIDQTRAFRPVGQVIDLLPNGLKALKLIDFAAYEAVKKTSIKFLSSTQSEEKSPKTSSQWVLKNLQLKPIRAISLKYDDWLQDYGEGRVSISWYELQTILRQMLPQEQVKANHRCINVVDEPGTGYIRVDCISNLGGEANPYAFWADESKRGDGQPQNLNTIPQQSETKSLRARIVVAADGINSTVRSVLYADTPYHAFAKPEYSGFAAVGCTEITSIPTALDPELKEKIFEDSPIVTISNAINLQYTSIEDPRMILFRGSSGHFGYLMHLALPLNLLGAGSELINLALQELEKFNFPHALKQLVRISPPGNMLRRPYYIHRASISTALQFPSTAQLNETDPIEVELPWSVGRVVLVGDAAHGMPPFMAQGGNQGLEDALVVATLIAELAQKNCWDNVPAIAAAFKKYERLRRPLMIRIQQATLQQISYGSQQEWQEYSQQVYCRNLDQVLAAEVNRV